MKKNEPVSHIMTQNVLFVNKADSLRKALDIVRTHHVRHLPVVSEDSVVGILSSTDLNRLTFSNLFENEESADDAIMDMLTIPNVMTDKPVVVNSENSIKEVAEVFSNKTFHALPVVEDEKLVGIVTTTDVIKYLLDQY